MYAAQMAYQQTMMAMSQAGSQMGDNATQDGRHSPSQNSIRAASPFGYGGYGMMAGAPMSMYGGFPQFMPGMPPMGGPGTPGQMPGQLGPLGWQSPPTGMRTSMMEPGGSHTGSERERDDRNAS
jgi:CCR4-NOT transcriptional complex subunit CAF120